MCWKGSTESISNIRRLHKHKEACKRRKARTYCKGYGDNSVYVDAHKLSGALILRNCYHRATGLGVFNEERKREHNNKGAGEGYEHIVGYCELTDGEISKIGNDNHFRRRTENNLRG